MLTVIILSVARLSQLFLFTSVVEREVSEVTRNTCVEQGVEAPCVFTSRQPETRPAPAKLRVPRVARRAAQKPN